jgi:hypothetical protein
LEQIADDGVAANAFEIGEIAGLANEEAEIGAFSGKGFGHVVADKACGAGNENFHSVFSELILNARRGYNGGAFQFKRKHGRDGL